MDENRLGKNIKALRIAFGETQQELGEAVYVEKSTIANYEKGARTPERETLSLIAKHFNVSVEGLIHSNFSDIGKITIDRKAFWRNIDIVFPLFPIKESDENSELKRIHNIHSSIYTQLKQGNSNNLEKIVSCVEGYGKALDNNKDDCEVIADFLAGWFLIIFMFKMSPVVLSRQPAALKQVAKRDSEVKKILEEIDPDFENEAKEIIDAMNDPEANEEIEEMINILKHAENWMDLADYYLALRYVYNLIDNDYEWEVNQLIGMEMMYTLLTVKNVYAAKYTILISETLKAKFTD